jgi:hypothetical protein
MSLWHYEKQGRAFGPVPAEHLKALLETGQLAADDAAWPAGADAPRRCRVAEAVAMSLAGPGGGALAAAREETAGPRSESPAAEHPPAARAEASSRRGCAWDSARTGIHRGAAYVRERAAGAISRTRQAARLAAFEARRTKLRKVTLPALHLALGRHVRRAGLFRDELPDLHGRLDALSRKLKDLRGAGEESDEFSSLADRAGEAAHRVAAAVQSEVVSARARNCLRELGKAAYDRFGDASGPEPLVSPLRDARRRMADLEARIDDLKASLSDLLSPRRAAVAGIAAALGAAAVLAAVAPRSFIRRPF